MTSFSSPSKKNKFKSFFPWLAPLIILTFFLMGLIVTTTVNQVTAADDKAPTVYEQNSYVEDIEQLTKQYRGELQEYRQVEAHYRVAKQQYQQLETLASLEEALRTTQEAFRLRNQVLMTYLRLIRFKLLTQPGVELSEKKTADQALKEAVADLKKHQQNFIQPLDKLELKQQATYFEENLATPVEDVAHRALINIKIGKLQTVYDKSLTLHQDMEQALATSSGALKSAARQRAFAENKRLLDKVGVKFDQVESKLLTTEAGGYRGLYRQLRGSLSELYADLRRSLTYLSELIGEQL